MSSLNILTNLPATTQDDYSDWPYPPNNYSNFDGAGLSGEENNKSMVLNITAINVLNSNLTNIFLPVIYIVIFIVGLPTNATAIWIFLFRTKKKHQSSILLANLALADLLFIIWLPLKISYHFNDNNWIFGELLCKVLVGFFYGNMYCSTIFIACISVQRYWAVVHPFSKKKSNNRAAVCVSVCVWLIVCIITTPLYLYDQTVKVTNLNITTCHDVTLPSQTHISNGYFLTMGIVGYVVPCVVCVVAYVMMFHFIRHSMINSKTTKNKRKAVILMITVLIMFLVCFTPSNIILMVHYSLLTAKIQNNTVYGFYIVVLCLSSLNSCIDPFVYYFISKDFREHVKNTLTCQSERTVKRMKASSLVKSSKETPSSTNTMTVKSNSCA